MSDHTILAQRLRGERLALEMQRAVARALRESVGPAAVPVATTGGDPALLRGIPVVGAVGGAMRGTRPDQVVR